MIKNIKKKQDQKDAVKSNIQKNFNRNFKVTFNDVKDNVRPIPTDTFINGNFLRLILFDKLYKVL